MSLVYFPVLALTLGLASARPQISEVQPGSGGQWLPPVQSGLPPNFQVDLIKTMVMNCPYNLSCLKS